jgi:phosphinothricin acetyltransferase
MIRLATIDDAASIAAIYNHYVLNTSITFEEEAVSNAAMAARIRETTESLPWLVFESDGEILGYAYASKWKSRCAYRYSVESTVYLKHGITRQGLGTQLYDRLLSDLRSKGMHSVIGGIALPNAASQGLHEKMGFRKIAHFEQVGWKFERWIDVGYWQLILPKKD